MDQNQEPEINLVEAFDRNPFACVYLFEKLDDIQSLDFRIRVYHLIPEIVRACNKKLCSSKAEYIMIVSVAGNSSPWMFIVCHKHLGEIEDMSTKPFMVH